MMHLFKIIVDAFRSNDTHNADVLRLAKVEYRKDWEHAYHMLMQGKKPSTGV
jgi:hypothetical protein